MKKKNNKINGIECGNIKISYQVVVCILVAIVLLVTISIALWLSTDGHKATLNNNPDGGTTFELQRKAQE